MAAKKASKAKASKAKAPAKPTMAEAFKSASKTVAKSGKSKSNPSLLPIPQPLPGPDTLATGEMLVGKPTRERPKVVPKGYSLQVLMSNPPMYKLVKKTVDDAVSKAKPADPGFVPRRNKNDKSVPMPTVPPQEPKRKYGKRKPGDVNF